MITRADLDRLDELAVVVLPNVLRMDDAEIAALRRYVERGGRLYASGYTSLVGTAGDRRGDFALADVFGCHFERPEQGVVSFLRPDREDVRAAVAPAAVVAHGSVTTGFMPWPSSVTALLVRAGEDAACLARLTQPYALGRGTRTAGWASIFTAPPWEDTDRAVIVEHAFGAGRAIYSACDIEAAAQHVDTGPAQNMFVALIRGLLGNDATFEADAHPNAWIVAFHEPEQQRYRINMLNHQAGEQPLPIPGIRLRLKAPEAKQFVALRRTANGEPVGFEIRGGLLEVQLPSLAFFDSLTADYR